MLSIILIAFISLIALLILHEFSHFIVAKKFKVDVEEFGIGYPPRLVAKKIGQTIYSLNLLPFGAFVRIPEEKMKGLPIGQRAAIMMAGVASFWIICIVLIAVVFLIGAPLQVSDTETDAINPFVQIVAISHGSPAETAGLKIGDTITKIKSQKSEVPEGEPSAPYGAGKTVDKVGQVQDFTSEHKGEEIIMTLKRGEEILEVKITPRISPPSGEGPLGVGLARVATKKYPLVSSLFQGALTTFKLTLEIVSGLFQMLKKIILGQASGVELVGPVGILGIFVSAGILGPVYLLQTVALISLHAAIINALPIPVADGGRVAFLILEKIRKKPLNEKIEQSINTVFFGLLVTLMIWVTIKDIGRIF